MFLEQYLNDERADGVFKAIEDAIMCTHISCFPPNFFFELRVVRFIDRISNRWPVTEI